MLAGNYVTVKLEEIIFRLFHANVLQLGPPEARPAATQIPYGKDSLWSAPPFAKAGSQIQIAMVEAHHHFGIHNLVQLGQIDHHAGPSFDRASHQHFHYVIVPVAVGIVALSIRRRFSSAVSASACRRWLALSM